MDRWMDGRTDGWMDVVTQYVCVHSHVRVVVRLCMPHRHARTHGCVDGLMDDDATMIYL